MKSMAVVIVFSLLGCLNESKSDQEAMGGQPIMDTVPKEVAGDRLQTPPPGQTNIEAWLQEGHYKKWACEAAAHPPRSPSGHSSNRICSNNLLSNAKGTYPVGSASVKELFSGSEINGYAIFLKTRESSGGETWYWYERIGSSLIADGQGDSGKAKSICVSCHSQAPSDQVFTQIKSP